VNTNEFALMTRPQVYIVVSSNCAGASYTIAISRLR
jgi:hypothetical protein